MRSFLDPKLAGLVPYSPGEQPKGMADLIKLNTNENPFPPSPAVLEALSVAALRDLRLYPDPACAKLAGAIAEYYGLSPENVFLGNGSDEVLAFCFHGLCAQGAVFADISYGFYPVFANMFGKPYTEIPLRENFSIAPMDYAGKAGTLFIANPNAPTGLALPLSQIEELLCQDPARLVVVDEAYVDFGAQSAKPLLSRYENLLVVQTFSKSRQLAGGRLAMALGNPAIIQALNTLKFSFNPYSVNRIALLAGEAALRDIAYFESCRTAIMENRAYTAQALGALGFTQLDSKANFIFAKPPRITAAEYQQALRARNILIRHFDKPRIREYVRISIGTAEQMRALVAATRDILFERS